MAEPRRDRNEFVAMLAPVRDGLYGYARRALWDKELAADVVQESVMTAWRGLATFERGTNFRAWMFRILVNTIYNFNRRTARRKEFTVADSTMEAFAELEREDAWAKLLDRPEVLADMLDERLVNALERLNSNEKRCFLLHQMQGFTYKEIATVLGMPLGTVMSHMHRARKNLRERLASLAVEHGLLKGAES